MTGFAQWSQVGHDWRGRRPRCANKVIVAESMDPWTAPSLEFKFRMDFPIGTEQHRGRQDEPHRTTAPRGEEDTSEEGAVGDHGIEKPSSIHFSNYVAKSFELPALHYEAHIAAVDSSRFYQATRLLCPMDNRLPKRRTTGGLSLSGSFIMDTGLLRAMDTFFQAWAIDAGSIAAALQGTWRACRAPIQRHCPVKYR